MATTNFDNWDFHNQRVQQSAIGGQFVSAETTLIASGPPSLSSREAYSTVGGDAGTAVYPIGLLESFGIQQNRQLQRLFEIGSSRSYFIPGRTIGSLSIGRTFYHGPSLLRAIYAYYKTTTSTISDIGTGTGGGETTQLLGTSESAHDLRENPGWGYLTINLASDLFAQPTGMAVYFKDINNATLGAFYLQESYVQGHQMSINSGSVLIMEGAQMQFDRLVPIKVSSVITDPTETEGIQEGTP